MNDGGPAFPRPASEYTANGTLPDGNEAITDQRGMSVRDYFAAAALKGIPNDAKFSEYTPSEIATMAYLIADAMIEARKT